MTTLDKVKRGQKVEICRIADERVRAQAIRFGLCEGSVSHLRGKAACGTGGRLCRLAGTGHRPRYCLQYHS